MSSSRSSLTLSVVGDIRELPEDQWNRLAGENLYSPFLEHEFLASLEESGCASAETGWYPRHFVLRDDKRIVAAAPAYIKTHSMGEFVFDQGLAQAVMQMGKSYYPKLVATLPFTPSPGYRFLVDFEYDENQIVRSFLDAMRDYSDQRGLASHSLLFVDPQWQNFWAEESGFLGWAHQYFLWENSGYRSFSDYLVRFKKNQRRNIRRERASISDQGLTVRILTGGDLNDAVLGKMFDFYHNTNRNFGPWAAFFLNKEWFRIIGKKWSHRVVIVSAYRSSRPEEPVAMSLLVRKNDQLIGRYWGAGGFFPNLHFELCYYAPIEYAINEGIKYFDPGMGSPHKARRGFGSREFQSAHSFADDTVAELFSAVLEEANRGEREAIAELDSSIPWSGANGNLTMS